MLASTRSVLMPRSRHSGVTLSTDLWTLLMIFFDIGLYVGLAFAEHSPIFSFSLLSSIRPHCRSLWVLLCGEVAHPSLLFVDAELDIFHTCFFPSSMDPNFEGHHTIAILILTSQTFRCYHVKNFGNNSGSTTDYIIWRWVFLSWLWPRIVLVLSDKTCQPASRGMPFLAGISKEWPSVVIRTSLRAHDKVLGSFCGCLLWPWVLSFISLVEPSKPPPLILHMRALTMPLPMFSPCLVI